jgi:1,4-dihydroxy-2-naphthoyl-CoA synthase
MLFAQKRLLNFFKLFHDAHEDTSVGVVLLSAEGPSSKDGVWSFVLVATKKLEDIKDMLAKMVIID